MQECTHAPQASAGRAYRPRKSRASALYQCAARHAPELKAGGRFDRHVEENVDGGFTVLPRIPREVLEPWFRRDVLTLLRREGLVSEALAGKMLAQRHTGFSAHNAVRVSARDPAGRRRLAQYMLRAPFSLEKMSYDPQSCMVIYRSRMHKTLKRNFQIMSGADWLAQLCAHIPDRFEHLVRYAGWYSNRSRGKRRSKDAQATEVATRDVEVREAARVRSIWARLIHKVYEVDPLECPKCKGPMRVIALIDDKAIIRKILTHLGLWVPQIAARRGPGPPTPGPREQVAQILTYHPVPDIA